MVRTLYRIYLYIVSLFLLFFSAIVTAIFLGIVLQATPLNGSYPSTLTQDQIVQPATLAVISWVATALIGGLHYWLIRRDMAGDPSAGSGATRSFFLNAAEGISAFVSILAGTIALSQTRYSGAASAYAVWFVFLGVFALLEIERRRTQAGPGAATVLQRLHLYGIQMIVLVFFLISSWIAALTQSLLAIFVAMGLVHPECNTFGPEPSSCFVNGVGTVDTPYLGLLWGSAAWVTFAWLAYAFFARRDNPRSRLRQVVHFAGLAIGIGVLIYAFERAAELVARWALGLGATFTDVVGTYNFISPALVALLVLAFYIFWLRRDVMREPQESRMTRLTILAITAGLMSLVFWAGCIALLRNAVEALVPGGTTVERSTWATSIALVVAGIGYIPVALRLRSETREPGAISAPRRGFVLALLALGTLTCAVGIIVMLYAVVTASLGSPVPDWQSLARTSAVTAAIGALVVAIYLRLAFAERWFHAPSTPATVEQPAETQATIPPTATTQPASSIEAVLDDLLGGKLTRDQAALRIRELTAVH
ncbi:MAG: hypothetical protein ACXWP6_20920 [Ktedonobacterales bacterium]